MPISKDIIESRRIAFTSRKLNRFNYLRIYEELLVKSVRKHDAHKITHLKK